MTHEEVIARYPGLTREGIEAAMAYEGPGQASSVHSRKVLPILIAAHMVLPLLLVAVIHLPMTAGAKNAFENWHLTPIALIPGAFFVKLPQSAGQPGLPPGQRLMSATLVRLAMPEAAVLVSVFVARSDLAVYLTLGLALAAMAVVGRQALASSKALRE
jgi:hypothetical protein